MSFSSDTKSYLCEKKPKRGCCRASLLYGILFGVKRFSREGIRFSTENGRIVKLIDELFQSCLSVRPAIDQIKKRERTMYNVSVSAEDTEKVIAAFPPPPALDRGVFRCGGCGKSFVRGVFISAGFVYPPPQCRVEMCVATEAAAEALSGLLSEITAAPKISKKITNSAKELYTLYYIDENNVEDFLVQIEATQTLFAIINEKIFNGMRNAANRSRNCDAANIKKSVDAAIAQNEAVALLIKAGALNGMDEKLAETARLRAENPEADLSGLAALHDPPISKSGVSHRLAKIAELAEEIRKKQGG